MSHNQRISIHQGSIIALTNEEGQIAERITYDGHFGEIMEHTKHEITHNPYGYTGREMDTPRLYYYSPSLHRFLSPDPIEHASGDYNWYRYVGNDPVNRVDPSGLEGWDTYANKIAGIGQGSQLGSKVANAASILWNNKNFISHYFFGFGKTMNIDPRSKLGKEILRHLKTKMDAKYKKAVTKLCNNPCGFIETTVDRVNFTNNKKLFSLGDSSLKTTTICNNGMCHFLFEVKDSFEDPLDIYDSIESPNIEIGIPYDIHFRYGIFGDVKCD